MSQEDYISLFSYQKKKSQPKYELWWNELNSTIYLSKEAPHFETQHWTLDSSWGSSIQLFPAFLSINYPLCLHLEVQNNTDISWVIP